MIFIRHALRNLENWRASSSRKPLIIRGARQFGKTTLVKEFARSYTHAILLNLENSSDMDVFNQYNQVRALQESLFLTKNISIGSINDTLLFIDEIQESPKAIQMLRYFYEDFPDLHVIASGSLLEFDMKEVKSFPVGRVQFLYTGLINNELGIQAEMLAYSDLSNSHKGAIIPHLITQELISLLSSDNKMPHFWIRDKKQSS